MPSRLKIASLTAATLVALSVASAGLADTVLLDLNNDGEIARGTAEQLADVCAQEPEPDRCLERRVHSGDVHFFEVFIDALSPEQRDAALDDAAGEGDLAILNLLHSAGASDLVNALRRATLGCKVSTLKALVDWGADPQITATAEFNEHAALWWVTWDAMANSGGFGDDPYDRSCLDVLSYLVSEKHVPGVVQEYGPEDHVNLMRMVLEDVAPTSELFYVFFNAGTPVNDADYEQAPLYGALFRWGREFVGPLLDAGADPNQIAHGEPMWRTFETQFGASDPATLALLRAHGAH